jgi:hypothetical protein
MKPDLNREEDHLVKATLLVDGAEMIEDIPCKIYLPERTNEKPHLIFKPSRGDAARVMGAHKGAFKAIVYGFDKKIESIFEAPEVFFSEVFTKHWGDGISETTAPGEPQDLLVVHPLRNREEPTKTHFVFWLSPNKFLAPCSICTTSYTGNIDYKVVRNIKFNIEEGVKLEFEKHYRSKSAPNGDLWQWSYLVACTELDTPANDVKSIQDHLLQHIDDFLILAGFAARQRTACLGWTATDKTAHATYYRSNYVFPDGKNSDLNDCVVDISDFEQFIEVCYPAFLKYENKLALRNALYSAIPSQTNTVETAFLHTFAGLETLILDFRRIENLELVMPPKEFLDFRKALQGFIGKSETPKLEASQRASLYSKLGELNRVSLREAFEIFCKRYEIDVSDLWPVFGNKDIVGLVEIRNKLIHGDPFPNEVYEAVFVGNEHLKYILERVLVRVLGWDIAKTKVTPTFLERYSTGIRDLRRMQEELKEFLSRGAE